jgi:hypothetical protein
MRAAKKNTPPDETPPSGESEKPASDVESEGKMPELRENAPETAPKKICARPGCTVELSSSNTCGRCRAHVRCTPSDDAHAHAAGNGAGEKANSKSNGTNGHTPKNGNGHAGFLEDRLDKLILSFPVSDKVKIVDCWIRGQL